MNKGLTSMLLDQSERSQWIFDFFLLLSLGLGLVVEPASRVVADTLVAKLLGNVEGHARAASTAAVEDDLVVLAKLLEA